MIPKKWKPVFGKDHARSKKISDESASEGIRSGALLFDLKRFREPVADLA
jgi:hypothetical protein